MFLNKRMGRFAPLSHLSGVRYGHPIPRCWLLGKSKHPCPNGALRILSELKRLQGPQHLGHGPKQGGQLVSTCDDIDVACLSIFDCDGSVVPELNHQVVQLARCVSRKAVHAVRQNVARSKDCKTLLHAVVRSGQINVTTDRQGAFLEVECNLYLLRDHQ